MFKRIASIAIAALMLGSTAVVAASAVEADEAVAAADESAVGADDNSAVGANEDTGSTGSGNVVYFEVPGDWKNFDKITIYLSGHTSGESNTFAWGSKKGFMTDEGNGVWSFDLADKGYDLSGDTYSCIFTGDWGIQTCNLIIDSGNFGDTAYCPGDQVENDVDSNKKSYVVKWKSGHNGNPLTITSIGNVIGDTYWPGEDNVSVFYTFISTTDNKSIKNATKFNGKTEQQTIDDTAKTLGLSLSQVEEQVKKAKDAGAELDWSADKSSLKAADNGNTSNKSSSNNNSSSTKTNTSSNTSSSTTAASVTSGEGTTVYFIIGGVMLAAIGVFFLARKKREY